MYSHVANTQSHHIESTHTSIQINTQYTYTQHYTMTKRTHKANTDAVTRLNTEWCTQTHTNEHERYARRV